MGEEILIRSTIAKLKVDGITEDSPLFYTIVQMNFAFDKLEKESLVLLLLLQFMLDILVNRPRLLVNLNTRGCFTIISTSMAK
jgi:transcriptional regulator of nitric oxide reductase